ncbi:MAG TPA: hypothetical protein VGF67_04230 [Ktedonobacteraceae bacterium]
MISDDEECSLLQELAAHPAQTWDGVVSRYLPAMRKQGDRLGSAAHLSGVVDIAQCIRETLQQARLLLPGLLPHQIVEPTLAEWFCRLAEERWKDLFVSTLITLYSQELVSYLGNMVNHNHQHVEDCIQETFRSAWQSVQRKSAAQIQSLYTGNPRA